MIIRKYVLGDIFNITPQDAQINEHALNCSKDEYLSKSHTIIFEHDFSIYAMVNINENSKLFSLLLSKHAKTKMISIFRGCKKETEKQERVKFKMVVVDGFKQGKRFAEMLSFRQTGEFVTLNNVKYNLYRRV